MNPRFRPGLWLLSAVAILALTLGVAHAQPPDDEFGGDDALAGDDDQGDDDPLAGDAQGDTTTADTSGSTGDTGATTVAAASQGGAGNAGYDKGFYIMSGDGAYKLRTNAYVQPLLYFESDNNEVVVDERNTTYNFRVNRARLTFSGHVFSDAMKYKFQADFARGGVSLRDFYIDYGVTDEIVVRVGQYKRPFSRQHLNSSSRLELVSRAITDDYSLASRDIGIMVHNNYEKSPELEWAVGVFNARQADVAVSPNWPDRMGPAIVARVGINSGTDANGKPLQGYAEADLEGGPLRFGVAGSVLIDLDSLDDDNDSLLPGVDGRNILAGVDFVVKNEGLSASGLFYIHNQETLAEVNSFLTQFGFHLQAGYMILPQHQVAGRFAMVSVDNGVDRDSFMEAAVGHSFYKFASHNLKLQTEIRIRGVEGEDFGDEIIGYSQLQLAF